ncbi:MAG: M23 family metallopeptidase [Pseudomonadota bacterium]
MGKRIVHRLHARIERAFPEQRVFLRSDGETRFIRLTSTTQFIAISGGAVVIGWTIVASAILFMSSLGAGNLRDQALREQALYEDRLNQLSADRDARTSDAAAAHERFALAMAEVSAMQSRLLASEERRKELEKGTEALQATLRSAIGERDAAMTRADTLQAELNETAQSVAPEFLQTEELAATVDFLTDALSSTAAARDEIVADTADAMAHIDTLELERELMAERNERIFSQLEEAVSVSLAPLDEMFNAAGLPADSIIETVRRGYSGQGGPLTPLTFSTRGTDEMPDAEMERANAILERLDALNLYRIAVEKTPFSEPVRGTYRYTSGFGPRRDPINGERRMHNGTDFAARHGAPIYATADGTVIKAGWATGYGRIVTIRHDFGIETRYAHLSRIRVSVGDRVSRGDQIGDMGNSGRSTGTHLHYEVRIDGEPVNPMKFIKAARDVF